MCGSDMPCRLTVASWLVVALAALAATPGVALATPVTLTSATWQPSPSPGTVSAASTLPSGNASNMIEFGRSAVTKADGSFNDFAGFAFLASDQTSFSEVRGMSPGTYYVHISSCPPGHDKPCYEPGLYPEWSNALSFVVASQTPPAPPPVAPPPAVPPPPPAAPGSGTGL